VQHRGSSGQYVKEGGLDSFDSPNRWQEPTFDVGVRAGDTPENDGEIGKFAPAPAGLDPRLVGAGRHRAGDSCGRTAEDDQRDQGQEAKASRNDPGWALHDIDLEELGSQSTPYVATGSAKSGMCAGAVELIGRTKALVVEELG
jgi:hypothetical protein